MSGGSLQVDEPYIGSGGNGQFPQAAGVFSVGTVTGSNSLAGGSLYLGEFTGDNGTYILSGNGMLSAYWEYVGGSGTGSFTQSGGTNSVANASRFSTLYLGYSASSSGSYSLSGSGLLSDYVADIGFAGVGVFNQTGGTHAVAAYIVLGASGGTGTYNLSGSGVLLVAGGEQVSNGSFAQSGGVNSISGTGSESTMGGLNLAGTYILSGNGLLSVTGTECVGYYGGGTFTQSGGTNVTGSLYVGYGNLGSAATISAAIASCRRATSTWGSNTWRVITVRPTFQEHLRSREAQTRSPPGFTSESIFQHNKARTTCLGECWCFRNCIQVPQQAPRFSISAAARLKRTTRSPAAFP